MRARVLVAVSITVFCTAVANARQVEFQVNHPVNQKPLDLAITTDSKKAVLRTGTFMAGTGSPGEICIMDLEPPWGIQQITSQADGTGQDYVALIGNHCITLPGTTGNTDIFELEPFSQVTQFGLTAVDVVTQTHPISGVPLGVIKAQPGPIQAIDLTSGLFVGVGGTAPIYGPNPTTDYGDSRFVSDSIQATSSRAIGITNFAPVLPGQQALDGFVGIVDLSGTPNVAQTHGFTCAPFTTCPGTHPAELVHDVAVTPDGTHGIVSGNGVLGVYRMKNASEAYKVIDHANLPHMRFMFGQLSRVTIDSVEASNTRAVIIGKDLLNGNDPFQQNENSKWRVTVVELPATQTVYSHVSFQDNSGVYAWSRAHDVAITPSGDKAIVATRGHTLLLDLTSPLSSLAPQPITTATDPLDYPQFTGNYVLVSDSVAVTDKSAVVIGRWRLPSTRARIAVVDLLAAPAPSSVTTFDSPDISGIAPETWLPTDVAIDPTGQYAIVRMVDLTLTAGVLQFPGRGRLVVIKLDSLQVILDQTTAHGLNPQNLGMAEGLDQVECSLTRIITAGDNFNTANAWWQALSLD